MSDKSNAAPALPGEVWRGDVPGFGYLCAVTVRGTLTQCWWWDAMWIRSADTIILAAYAEAMRVRAERCAEAGRAWQKACKRLAAATGPSEIAEAARARDEAAAACVNACAGLAEEIDTAARDDA